MPWVNKAVCAKVAQETNRDLETNYKKVKVAIKRLVRTFLLISQTFPLLPAGRLENTQVTFSDLLFLLVYELFEWWGNDYAHDNNNTEYLFVQ